MQKKTKRKLCTSLCLLPSLLLGACSSDQTSTTSPDTQAETDAQNIEEIQTETEAFVELTEAETITYEPAPGLDTREHEQVLAYFRDLFGDDYSFIRSLTPEEIITAAGIEESETEITETAITKTGSSASSPIRSEGEETDAFPAKREETYALLTEHETGTISGETDLTETALSETEPGRTDMDQTDLSQADSGRADMDQTDLSQADSGRTDMNQIDLSEADSGRTDMDQTDLSQADSGRTDMDQIDLSEADSGRTDVDQTALSESASVQTDITEAASEQTALSETASEQTALSAETLVQTVLSETALDQADITGMNSDDPRQFETGSDQTELSEAASDKTASSETQTMPDASNAGSSDLLSSIVKEKLTQTLSNFISGSKSSDTETAQTPHPAETETVSQIQSESANNVPQDIVSDSSESASDTLPNHIADESETNTGNTQDIIDNAPESDIDTTKEVMISESESDTETPDSSVPSKEIAVIPADNNPGPLRDLVSMYRVDNIRLPKWKLTMELLKTRLETMIAHYEGTWSVGVMNLETGETITINDSSMKSASIMKLFVMAAVYDGIDKGTIERTSETVSRITSMISASSNEDANKLLLLLGNGSCRNGIAKVNEYIVSHGYSALTRQYNGFNNADYVIHPDHFNSVCVSDCMRLLEQVYHRTFGSWKVCNEIETNMLNQSTRYKIPKGIASVANDVKIGNKTGEMDYVENDVAIVYSQACDYIICVLSDGWTNKDAAQTQIQQLSAETYRFFNDRNWLSSIAHIPPALIKNTSDTKNR